MILYRKVTYRKDTSICLQMCKSSTKLKSIGGREKKLMYEHTSGPSPVKRVPGKQGPLVPRTNKTRTMGSWVGPIQVISPTFTPGVSPKLRTLDP